MFSRKVLTNEAKKTESDPNFWIFPDTTEEVPPLVCGNYEVIDPYGNGLNSLGRAIAAKITHLNRGMHGSCMMKTEAEHAAVINLVLEKKQKSEWIF